MRVVTKIDDVRAMRCASPGTLGLVPTMGYLHLGHRSLLERARRENDLVAASLFVNPTQFGPGEDLARYPRAFEQDVALLEGAGCDLLFAPSVEEMYLPGSETGVEVGKVSAPLEGARRPGHFRGVATVVLKLFGIFEPDRAYFGEKDAQQLAVIRAFVRDLNVPVEVVGCPTVREADGLAMSTRNSYLGPEERKAATILIRSLRAAEDLFKAGQRDAQALREAMTGVLEEEPLVHPDYVSVADPLTFEELRTIQGRARLLVAARVGRARLIDNLLL